MKISIAWGKGGAQRAAFAAPHTPPLPTSSSSSSPPPTVKLESSDTPLDHDIKRSQHAAEQSSTQPSPSSSSAPSAPSIIPPTSSTSSSTPPTLHPPSSSPPPLPNPSSPVDAALAVDAFLAEETLADRLTAIARILSAFQLNPFDVLGLATSVSTVELNRHFRALSLLVHPDKVGAEHREDAQKAFARLSDARAALLDEERREALDEVVSRARQTVITERERDGKRRRGEGEGGVVVVSSAGYDATRDEDFDAAVSTVMRELLIDREWRKRQLLKAGTVTEGREQAEREERQRAKEEKAKEEAEYEDDGKRGQRIHSWRSFVQGGGSRKHKLGMRATPRTTQVDAQHTYVRRVARDDDNPFT